VREFRLPDIGEGLTEAEIVKWHVPVGGPVAVDETVVEVETDKAVVEIPSPFAGVVVHHGGEEGEVVRVGDVLVVIGDPSEAWPPPAPVESAELRTAEPARPIVGTISEDAVDLTPGPPPVQSERRRPQALPQVRRLAAALGVDLASIEGTGPGGRVSRDDVEAAAGRDAAPVAGTDRRQPLSKLRRTIAANLSRSWAEIPQVTAFDTVDATRLLAVRRALQARHGVPVPLDALFVAAVVPVLRAFPDVNASLDGDTLVVHARLDIGVAVDTPDGLVVATIRDAGAKGVLDLAAEVARLGERGKSRTLTPAELTGQTFTVSNIGAVGGGGHGTPIVPYGTVGILSVGRAADQPVAREGRVEVAPVMPLSLSYDHRVIDGAAGRRFLAVLVENLAEPALFLA
jgi:pyruvate/2-oxoglutarate dehydrogenase complex dihydrolipoamide acyltransferase (E2) component